jgi:hypothetical protein
MAEVVLTEVSYGYTFTESVPCTSNAWTGTIYPGTYRIQVTGEYSNVPSASETVVDRIVLP